jgi:hypothetical protein
MRRFQWCYDLGRQASGAFWFAPDHDSLDPTESGISLALAYTAPLRKLQINGAPRSPHARDFTLPERLWGTEADLAFLSSRHHKDFYKYGEEEEIHIPWRQLPHGLRGQYGPHTVKGLDLNVMLKNVHHARCNVRTAAAKALCFSGHFKEIGDLLGSPDPRLRRAALDGISDCNPWFTSPTAGQHALAPGQFTPAMGEAVTRIMSNPEEAWFVIDGALTVLSIAPIPVLQENLPNILKWTTVEDWWLRESAFLALMGLQRDEALFVSHLPTIIDMMIREYNYNPRNKMVSQLTEALQKLGNDSPAGKMIIAGFARAALESTILPDAGKYERAREGATNVVEVALASIRQAPGNAADLAEALARGGVLKSLGTADLMNVVKAPDGHVQDRYVGLYPALDKVPAGRRQRLADILYGVFRPELIRHHQAAAEPDPRLLDMIIELTRLKQATAGWQPLGTPQPAGRTWRFRSFDPLTADEKLHPRIGPPQRLRDVTLPPGMAGWYQPGFDDSAWHTGKTPIGVGRFIAHGHGRGWTYRPDFFYPNNSAWGDGEFLVMRTSFEVDDLDYDFFRINILADQGYDIYLNGHRISSYSWFQHFPRYEQIMLTDSVKKHLKKGANTLAARGVVRYEKDEKTGEYHPVGQMDLWLEGLKQEDLGLRK